MPSFLVKSTIFNRVANADKVETALMNGNVIPPIVISHEKGEIIELSDEHAERHLELGTIERPGERHERAKAQAEAQLEAATAEIERQKAAVAQAEKAADAAAAKSTKSG